jgi:hypothetical protein
MDAANSPRVKCHVSKGYYHSNGVIVSHEFPLKLHIMAPTPYAGASIHNKHLSRGSHWVWELPLLLGVLMYESASPLAFFLHCGKKKLFDLFNFPPKNRQGKSRRYANGA